MTSIFKGYSLVLFLVCFFMSKLSHSQIFAFVDSSGKLIISDKKENDQFKQFDPLINSVYKGMRKNAGDAALNDAKKKHNVADSAGGKKYDDLINTIAQEVGISAHLLHAVIQVESAYNPNATSPKGAMGLMQLIPATAERFGAYRVYDPESNVRGGARFLKYLLLQFNHNLQLALAAYNAGEGAVKKYNNTIPAYAETQDYVSRVTTIFEQRKTREQTNY
jgi:soluble lytic murein transglycosylase-like protein